MTIFWSFGCHLCSEKGFTDLHQLSAHWQRDHNYHVTFRMVQS